MEAKTSSSWTTAVLLITAFFVVVPLISRAQEGNAMCIPTIPVCKCMEIMKDGKCVGGMNKFKCFCQETENGYMSSGECVAGSICKTTGTSDGKGPDQGMSKLGEILGKLMEALKGKDGGGGSPPPPGTPPGGQGCTTMQPTGDKERALTDPMCYYLDPTLEEKTDPSGGLVATPTEGQAPLTVYFAFTNGTAGCGTPALALDFGDGKAAEPQQVHPETTCNGISETTQHVFTTEGQYAVRLKKISTDEVRGGVNLTVTPGDGTTTPAVGNNPTGVSTNIGSTAGTGGTNSNISASSFVTPLTNLTNSGTVNSGRTGGSSALLDFTPAGSASTGGSNFGGPEAKLNFNTPQSIVQSIIAKNLPPGAYGDVRIMENGTTIIAGVREGNTEVAGFFGTKTSAGQSTSAVARLCTNRPWASNFLSFIIPPTFFDTLCSWRGYTVGAQTQTTTPTTIQTGAKPATTKTQIGGSKSGTTSAPTNGAKVDIWASPATVPLGARTSIFWSSQGTTECIETSPDGSFTHNSLKGGASTVPLTSPTTYTISCLASDGSHVVDSVTVQMAI